MNTRGKLTTWLLLAITATGLLHTPVFAASQPVQGLALSPPRSEFDVLPDGVKHLIVNIANFTNGTAKVQLDAEQFNITDERYDYAFSVDTHVSKWASFGLSQLNLTANQNVDVPVTITVPTAAEPGGYYISLFASSSVQTAASDVQAQQRVASLLYITVDGKVTRVGSLKSISSPFVYDGSQPWNIRIANSGTAHFRSNYSASVQNIFDGKEVVVATGKALILPHSTRAIAAKMPVPQHIGVYKIVYTVGLGDSPLATRAYYLIFLPRQYYIPLISLVIIIIAGLGYGVWKLLRRRKRAKS